MTKSRGEAAVQVVGDRAKTLLWVVALASRTHDLGVLAAASRRRRAVLWSVLFVAHQRRARVERTKPACMNACCRDVAALCRLCFLRSQNRYLFEKTTVCVRVSGAETSVAELVPEDGGDDDGYRLKTESG